MNPHPLHKRKLDDAARRRLVRRYRDGEESLEEIARAFNVTARTVSRVVADAGATHARKQLVTDDVRALLVAYYHAGHTIRATADHYSVSPHAMRNALRKLNAKTRSFRAALKLRRRTPRTDFRKQPPKDIRPYWRG